MRPIPLRSPDGTIYAYACGACKHLGTTGQFLVRIKPGELAESSLAEALACCRCRECNKPLKASDGRSYRCQACSEKERAAVAESNARLEAERAAAPTMPDTPKAKALRDILLAYMDIYPDEADEAGLKILEALGVQP